jgi:hypothetical protein
VCKSPIARIGCAICTACDLHTPVVSMADKLLLIWFPSLWRSFVNNGWRFLSMNRVVLNDVSFARIVAVCNVLEFENIVTIWFSITIILLAQSEVLPSEESQT